MHVSTQRRHYTGKDGQERVYETHLLRRSWREGGKVRNETVANLSKLPPETIELVRRSLAGERFIPAGAAAQVARSLPHGHAAAVHAMARKLGFPALLGPPGPGPGPGLRAGHLPGAAPGLQAVHRRLVGRRDPGAGPGRGRGRHR